MKRILVLALWLNCVVCGLFAQKKSKNNRQSYFGVMSGYSFTGHGFAFPLNFEYQYRYKRWGIGAGMTVENEIYKYGNLNRLYEIGFDTKQVSVLNINIYPLAYQRTEHWLNIAPSLLGYFYFVQSEKWDVFFRTGIIANYNIAYFYKGSEFRIDNQGIVTDAGPVLVKSVTKPQVLQNEDPLSINWLFGLGCQYKLNKKLTLRLIPEMQRQRGISILGGLSFKI
jgi:hypothetical protein